MHTVICGFIRSAKEDRKSGKEIKNILLSSGYDIQDVKRAFKKEGYIVSKDIMTLNVSDLPVA